MSASTRAARTRRRAGVVAAAVAMLGSALVAGGAASGQDEEAARATEVIDAGENADAAAAVINEYCADREKCQWSDDGDYETAYGPAHLVGDVLYNCSLPGAGQEPAETAVDIEDSTSNSTTVSEKITVEASLSFLGLAESSLAASVFSSQAEHFVTTSTLEHGTDVAPGYKGWTVSKVLGADFTGALHITDGPRDVRVTDIDVTIAGIRGRDYQRSGDNDIAFSGDATPMSAIEVAKYCPKSLPAVSVKGVTAAQVAAGAPLRLRKEHFKITVCRPGAGAKAKPRSCVKVPAVGRKATPKHGHVVAELERNGKVYARERHRPGGIKLVQVRTITPGEYRLVLHEKTKRYVVRNKSGKRLHSVSHEFNTYVPLKIKWSRKL